MFYQVHPLWPEIQHYTTKPTRQNSAYVDRKVMYGAVADTVAVVQTDGDALAASQNAPKPIKINEAILLLFGKQTSYSILLQNTMFELLNPQTTCSHARHSGTHINYHQQTKVNDDKNGNRGLRYVQSCWM